MCAELAPVGNPYKREKEMKNFLFVLALIMMLVLAGCSGKLVYVKVVQEAEGKFTKEDPEKAVVINQIIRIDDSNLTSETDQASSLKGTIPLAMQGGTASGAIEGDASQSGSTPNFDQDNSLRDSMNPKTETTTSNTTQPVIEQPLPIDEPGEEGTVIEKPISEEYNDVESYDLRAINGNNKKFNWMKHNGNYYGKNIKAVFSDGYIFVIADGSKTAGKDGSAGNYNQAFWFSGNDFVSGQAEYNPSLQ